MIVFFGLAALLGVICSVFALPELQSENGRPTALGLALVAFAAAGWVIGEALDVDAAADGGAALVLLLIVAYGCIYGGTAPQWRRDLGLERDESLSD